MGKFDHLDPYVSGLLSWTDEDRIDFINKDKWIAHTVARELLSDIENLLKAPDRERKKFLLIEGKSGSGKTSLLKHFYKQHPPSRSGGNLISPVILIEGPAGPSVDGLYAKILTNINAPIVGGVVNKEVQLDKLLRDVGAKVLMIDNFHDFKYGNSTLRMKYIAAVRKLCTENKLSMVAASTYIARNVISRDAQILTRFTFRTLPIWKYNNEYLNLLAAFERILPLKKKSHLADEHLAWKILKMSDGILGNVEEILQESAKMAIETRKERVDTDILKRIPFNRKHEPQPIEKSEYTEDYLT